MIIIKILILIFIKILIITIIIIIITTMIKLFNGVHTWFSGAALLAQARERLAGFSPHQTVMSAFQKHFAFSLNLQHLLNLTFVGSNP